MKLLILTLSAAIICLTSGCADAQSTAPKKILIVYLSRTSNTRALAGLIQQKAGGKMVALELVKPYPEDYQATVKQVAKENETGFLPELSTSIDSIQDYDLVFIGFPTWGMQMPPPMKSFLTKYPLAGTTVVPFNTNAGYGIGSGFEEVKKLCPRATVLEGFSIKGGVERDGIMFVMEGDKEREASMAIDDWLRKLDIPVKK